MKGTHDGPVLHPAHDQIGELPEHVHGAVDVGSVGSAVVPLRKKNQIRSNSFGRRLVFALPSDRPPPPRVVEAVLRLWRPVEVDQDLEADVVTPGEEALEVEALENWEKMIIIFLGENFGICKVFLFFTCPSSSDWGGGGKGSSGVTSTILGGVEEN